MSSYLSIHRSIYIYISTHQYPFYPGTGADNEKGKHSNILNIPLPAGTNSEEYMYAYEHVLKKQLMMVWVI